METGRYILVVEDDQVTRLATQMFLQGDGYRVVCVGDGQEALDYLRDHAPPSLILLDLTLPAVSGRQFRQRQQQDPAWASVPVIVVSADGGLAENAKGLEADDFLQKPVDPATLLETVRRHTR